jgi:hypothetical protein
MPHAPATRPVVRAHRAALSLPSLPALACAFALVHPATAGASEPPSLPSTSLQAIAPLPEVPVPSRVDRPSVLDVEVLSLVEIGPQPPQRIEWIPAKPSRPSPLLPLYVSYAALQVADVHSTRRALAAGAVEANPLLGAIASRPVLMVAVKAGVTAFTIVAAERAWKKHPVAAVVLLAAMNGLYTWVAVHNHGVIRRLEAQRR